MINKKDITTKIINLVEKETEFTEIKETDVINMMTITEEDYSSNILSSLGLISVLVSLEREYEIEITDDELFKFKTIDELAEIISQK